MPLEWTVRIPSGSSAELALALNDLETQGWRVTHVMPNGVDRWTVTACRARPSRVDATPKPSRKR